MPTQKRFDVIGIDDCSCSKEDSEAAGRWVETDAGPRFVEEDSPLARAKANAKADAARAATGGAPIGAFTKDGQVTTRDAKVPASSIEEAKARVAAEAAQDAKAGAPRGAWTKTK